MTSEDIASQVLLAVQHVRLRRDISRPGSTLSVGIAFRGNAPGSKATWNLNVLALKSGLKENNFRKAGNTHPSLITRPKAHSRFRLMKMNHHDADNVCRRAIRTDQGQPNNLFFFSFPLITH